MSNQGLGSFQTRKEAWESIIKLTRTNLEWFIDLGTSKFEDILQSDSFIDKTLLIRDVVRVTQCVDVLVTAPRKFGKSVNADMIRCFLSIEVDEKGDPIPRSEAKNYKMFTSPIPKSTGRKLLIAEDEEFVDEHLGQYPVIFVDFKCPPVRTLEDTISECKRVIHESFCEHKYLCESSKLDPDEIWFCKKWCSNTEYQSFNKSEVVVGLKLLAEFLAKHFSSKCFVIVDEYDSIYTSAMFEVEEPILRRMTEFFISCLDFVANGNKFVKSNFITGISEMCKKGSGKLRNIVYGSFLPNVGFEQFYGLTNEEMVHLKERMSISQEKLASV
ncbi:uncharacterized protein LOC135845461 isoform X2 [Planococcus citri]|uniref:uncharacterized protein LOC135845461 isoform X2 n=1 Tax=Planococcus citri TaxID=170843 RepID=UPI0031F93F97